MSELQTANHSNPENLDILYKKIYSQVNQARRNVAYSINSEMVTAYWSIGRMIVEEEQKGASRARYGEELLSVISMKLKQDFGKGFGVSTLRYMRLFYLTYQIHHTVCDESGEARKTPDFNPNLAWSHYRILIKIKREDARSFYEIEAIKNNWSVREMERQISSLLFERLAKSKDKAGVLALAQHGQEVSKPADFVKDPVVLEFLDLPESHQLVESNLEQRLISNLQAFLLEMGKGLAFVARQQRLTLNGDHFYVDLVFYHTILKCYVLIDLKVKKLSHGDLGQMLTYVNYYDQECLTDGDNPTVGLILCTEKNDAIVKYALGEKNSQIFASKYQFHLPSIEQLETELKKEMQILQDKSKI